MPLREKKWEGVLSDETRKKTYLSRVKDLDEKVGAFLELDVERSRGNPANGTRLQGIPFAVKDNIAVDGFHLTCGSRMLENFISPYSATAVTKLQDEGAVVIGKTNLDEFGMGSSTDNSALGKTNNPWELSRVAGGSSGGSVAAVAAGMVPFALCSDTGGSIRQPASFCGVYGLKPTYGSVSRYGLVAYASSLEVIGVASRTVDTARTVFEVMRGQDPMDHTSLEYAPPAPEKSSGKIGFITGDLGLDPAVERAYRDCRNTLQDLGYELTEMTFPTSEYVVPAYYTIATAEASSNLARFNGIRYGHRPDFAENPDELVRIARDEGFGDEVKLRILLGTYVLRSGFQDQYYLRAQKIRTAIRNDLNRIFSDVDMILMPVFPTQAFPHGDAGLDAFQQKLADRFTSTANLAGIPALAFPVAVTNGLPVGMQLMAPPFAEDLLFDTVSRYEEKYPAPIPPANYLDWS